MLIFTALPRKFFKTHIFRLYNISEKFGMLQLLKCRPKQLMNQMMRYLMLMMKMTCTLMMELLHQLLQWYKAKMMTFVDTVF